MRRRRDKNDSGLNVWRSYSDLMAGILLLFVLIMCVTLFQSQVNYENSIKEREEKLYLQEEYTKEIMNQKDIVADQAGQLLDKDDKLATQEELLAAQKQQLDDLAVVLADQQDKLDEQQTKLDEQQTKLDEQQIKLDEQQTKLDEQQTKLDEQSVTLTNQQTALDEKTTQLAEQQEKIDKIIGVKAEVIEALSREFSSNNVEVQIDRTTGSMVMDSNVLFGYDKTNLSNAGQKILKVALPVYCEVLLQEEYLPYIAEIMIDGYTDSTGGYAYNLNLSQQRAMAVAEYMLDLTDKSLSYEKQEELRGKLSVNGHSSSNLILDENGNEDAKKSRRVEVKFRLKDEEMIQELQDILS